MFYFKTGCTLLILGMLYSQHHAKALANPALPLIPSTVQKISTMIKPLGVGIPAVVITTYLTHKILHKSNSLNFFKQKSSPFFSPTFSEKTIHLTSSSPAPNVFFSALRALMKSPEQNVVTQEMLIKQEGPEHEKMFLLELEEYQDQNGEYFQDLENDLTEYRNYDWEGDLKQQFIQRVEENRVYVQHMKLMQYRQAFYKKTKSLDQWEAMVDKAIDTYRIGSLIKYHRHIKERGAEYESTLLPELQRLSLDLAHGESIDYDGYMDHESLEAHPNPEVQEMVEELEPQILIYDDVKSILQEVQLRQATYQKTKSLGQWEGMVERHILELKAKQENLSTF